VTVPKAKKIAAAPTPAPGATPAPAPAAATAAGITPQQAAMLQSMQRRYCRSCQVASVDAFCHIPYDFAKPNVAFKSQVVDWGTVTKVETEVGEFRDEKINVDIITLKGQRQMYRFDTDFLDTHIEAKVGDQLAICPDDTSDIYQLSGGPADRTRAVITLSAPPNIALATKYQAKHVYELKFAASSTYDDLRGLDPNGHFLVRVGVEAAEGNGLYLMDRYWLQVGPGVPGAAKIAAAAATKNKKQKHLWMIVERPELREDWSGSGSKDKRLVVHATAVIDGELFPGP
jgi:hypothetical protein